MAEEVLVAPAPRDPLKRPADVAMLGARLALGLDRDRESEFLAAVDLELRRASHPRAVGVRDDGRLLVGLAFGVGACASARAEAAKGQLRALVHARMGSVPLPQLTVDFWADSLSHDTRGLLPEQRDLAKARLRAMSGAQVLSADWIAAWWLTERLLAAGSTEDRGLLQHFLVEGTRACAGKSLSGHTLGLTDILLLDQAVVAAQSRQSNPRIEQRLRSAARRTPLPSSTPRAREETEHMQPAADLLIVTVTPVESRAVCDAFRHATGQAPQTVSLGERVYRNLGIVNGTQTFLALSEMGSSGLGGAQQTVQKAITALRPGAVIMVGIAFGMNEHKQSIGDILVSSQLLLYDLQRIGTNAIVPRGDKPHASPRLLNYLRSAELDWTGPRVRPGLVLTGDKLVDNVDYRDDLQRLEPEAVGGEMEGGGLYVACAEEKVDWIVVKSICDWADGNKAEDKDARQRRAAQNAASFVVHALQHASLAASVTTALEHRSDSRVVGSSRVRAHYNNVVSNAQRGGITAAVVHVGTATEGAAMGRVSCDDEDPAER